MAFYRAIVRIPVDTGAPADTCVNTLHFRTSGTDTTAAELEEIGDAIETMLLAIDSSLSENCGTDVEVSIYDMEDPPARVAVHERTVVITPGASSLPNQLAVVVSLHGQQFSGSPRGRRRGRLYFGPLAAGALNDTTGDNSVHQAFRDNFGQAIGAMLPTLNGASTSDINLAVFSVSNALDLAVGQPHPPDTGFTAGQLNEGFANVIEARVGNRFGVQRRRRTGVTSYSTYT